MIAVTVKYGRGTAGALHDVAAVVPSDDSLVLSRLVGGGEVKPIL